MLQQSLKDNHRQCCRVTFVALVALLLLAACSSSNSGTSSSQSTEPSSASTPSVSTTSPVAHVNIVTRGATYAFDPAILTIKVGTKVIWTNTSNAPHTVSSDTGVFDTPDASGINSGQMYSFTFTKPGTYPYYCNIHTYMTGKIIVTA